MSQHLPEVVKHEVSKFIVKMWHCLRLVLK